MRTRRNRNRWNSSRKKEKMIVMQWEQEEIEIDEIQVEKKKIIVMQWEQEEIEIDEIQVEKRK